MWLQVQAHEKELLYLDPRAYYADAYADAYDTFRVKLRTLILVLVLLVKK